MRTRRIVVRKDGALGGWTVVLDGEPASTPGVPTRKVAAFVDGLETGLAWADPHTQTAVIVENEHKLLPAAARFAGRAALDITEIALVLLAAAIALYGIVNLYELGRIGLTDWETLHFTQHAAAQVACILVTYALITGRVRLPRRRRTVTWTFE